MLYFLDTEFVEDGRTIDLISIGIISEDNREFYCISTEFDETKANDWVTENVISKLEPRNQNSATFWKPRIAIKNELLAFINKDNNPQFYAYYADYDWIALCQLFGTMIDLPNHFPMYCRDLKQTIDELENPKLPEQKEGEHNALSDAKWLRESYMWLKDKYSHSAWSK